MLGLGNSITGGAAVSEVLPSDISNLGIWLKNDTNIVAGQWNDSSGNGRHAVQATADQQASVSDGGLDFGDSADPENFYQISADTSALINVKHPNAFTLAAVVKRSSISSGGNILFAQTNANEFIGFLTDENAFGIHSKVATFTGEPWAEDEKLLITVTKDTSGNFAFFKNGVSESITSGDTASTETNNLKLDYFGCVRDGTESNDKHFEGIIYEVVVYESALTGSDLTNLNSYLTGKFGL